MTSTPSPHQINTDTLTGQLTPIRKVVLAMGSNIGDREGNLAGAVMSLPREPHSAKRSSSLAEPATELKL